MNGEAPIRAGQLFWASAVGSIGLHAWLLFANGPLHGGADLNPHLRLIQLMVDEPALRTPYPPTYHALGALLTPWIGLSAYPKWFALVSAIGLIAGFRSFQRGAGLPDEASALFAWAPYAFSLSWCLPKIEAAGYAIAFAALGLLVRRHYVGLALALAATFFVHTAAALFAGLCGGVLALSRRDARALGALAIGSLGAVPLLASHLAAGCSLAESLLFSPGDYLRSQSPVWSLDRFLRVFVLAGPIAIAAALFGARHLWERERSLAVLCVVVLALYLNELWLAPFGVGTTLNLQRGLTIWAFPIAIAGGMGLATAPRRSATAVVAACAIWALGSSVLAVPGSCYTARIDIASIDRIDVDRCLFRWYGPRQGHVP